MSLKVEALDARLEETFFDHVWRNPLEYFWFILDWKYNRAETRIFLALEQSEIRGMLLTYGEKTAQVRGSREAVEALMEHLTLPLVEMSAPKDCRDLVLRRYASPMTAEIMLMHLDKGHEKTHKVCEPVTLTVRDASDIVALLKRSNPGGWWDDARAEQIVQKMETTYWKGIRVEAGLVSVGNTRFIDFGSNVGVVATDEAHRNRGFATTIVSALVEEIFRRHGKALIHVLKDNAPAVRAYWKVGFRPYNTYFLIRNGVRI